MNVISNTNEILNAEVSLKTIEGIYGLVMESRSGAKRSLHERNTDYSIALETLLKRLIDTGIETVRIYVVSANAMRIWSIEERAIEIEGKIDIVIKGSNPNELRRQISTAQQNKKENPSSTGGNPTKRILINAEISNDSWQIIIHGNTTAAPISEEEIIDREDNFDPTSIEESNEKVSRAISLRRGQAMFRKKLLKAYDERCAITDTNFVPILEAAHIIPYQGARTNHIANGILLRTDMHTLFDLGYIGIGQQYQVVTAPPLRGTEYQKYHGSIMRLPKSESERPSLIALASRPLPSIN